MSIATIPQWQERIAIAGSRKRFSVSRKTVLGVLADKFSDVLSSICSIKFNPRWSESLANPGSVVSLAELRQDSQTQINLDIDVAGVPERTISIASGTKTVQQLIDEINAPNANGAQYWIAGLSDFAPSTIIGTNWVSNVAPSSINALSGENDELFVTTRPNVSNVFGLAAGTGGASYGMGDDVPSYLETDYNYPLTPATNPLHVGRGGGVSASQGEDILPQRASKFGTRQQGRASEMNPADARFVTVVDSIQNDGVVIGANEPIVYTIMEADGNVVFRTQQPDTVNLIQVPRVACRGAAFLTARGNLGGTIGSGRISMHGDIRVA